MGWCRRRSQHELSLVADLTDRAQSPARTLPRGPLPICQRSDLRSDLENQRLALPEVRADQYMPAGLGILFRQRVLGEGGFADEHGSDRTSRSAGSSPHTALSAVERTTCQRRQSGRQGRVPAAPESARSGPGRAGAMDGPRSMGDDGYAAARFGRFRDWGTARLRRRCRNRRSDFPSSRESPIRV